MTRLLGVLAVAALICWSASSCWAAQFWFADLDPVHQNYPRDYMDLFAPGAPWGKAESRLTVFKIAAETVLHGSDDMLRTMFNFLRQHHIAVAMEMGALLQSEDEICGGSEGFVLPRQIQRIGTVLRNLGYSLDYMAMDGPVWTGHERSWRVIRGRPDCQYSVDEVVRRASQTVSMMRQYFPSIKAGEIEAVNSRLPAEIVLADYAAFARAMRQATGQGLAFFHCDVDWKSPELPAILPRMRAQAHALGMRFGVIVGGGLQAAPDEVWVDNALDLLSQVAPLLDDVVIQSWQTVPTRMLPETSPGTGTYFLRKAEAVH